MVKRMPADARSLLSASSAESTGRSGRVASVTRNTHAMLCWRVLCCRVLCCVCAGVCTRHFPQSAGRLSSGGMASPPAWAALTRCDTCMFVDVADIVARSLVIQECQEARQHVDDTLESGHCLLSPWYAAHLLKGCTTHKAPHAMPCTACTEQLHMAIYIMFYISSTFLTALKCSLLRDNVLCL